VIRFGALLGLFDHMLVKVARGCHWPIPVSLTIEQVAALAFVVETNIPVHNHG
jgi:hypothetical protein